MNDVTKIVAKLPSDARTRMILYNKSVGTVGVHNDTFMI